MRQVRHLLPTALALAALLAACGDAETTDDRQWYTKAPLEDPGLTITPETPSEMAQLGAPDLMGTAQAQGEGEGAADAAPSPADSGAAGAGPGGPPADSAGSAGPPGG